MSEPIRAVYDCMILLQAAGRPERVHGTMRAVEEGRVKLCFSPDTIGELRDVLTRPEVRERFPSLLAEHVNSFISKLLRDALLIDRVPSVFAVHATRRTRRMLTWRSRRRPASLSRGTSVI